jgi:hypothetical protein
METLTDQVLRMETQMDQVTGWLQLAVHHFPKQIFRPELTLLRQLPGHLPENQSL